MSRVTLLIFMLLSPLVATSQNAPDSSEYNFFPFHHNRKKVWGYSDKDGNVLIKPAYEKVHGFFKGFALVKNRKGWGIINTKGEFAVMAEHDSIVLRKHDGSYLIRDGDSTYRKYIINRHLVDNPGEPEKPGMAFMEGEHTPATEEKVVIGSMRAFNPMARRYELWRYKDEPGKERDVIAKEQFPFSYFSEPVEKEGWMFSYYRSADSTKTGLLAWMETDWRSPALLDATYDSIWPYIHYNATFFGKQGDKISVINFNRQSSQFYETSPVFDDVKTWSAVFVVVRIGNQWWELRHFGEYLPSLGKIQKELDLVPIVANVDDILPSGESAFYFYRKKGLLGLIYFRKKPDGKSEFIAYPAKYSSIRRRPDYFFNLDMIRDEYYLWEVTTTDGRKGDISSAGVELFK